MGFFDKMKASLGIGGAEVETTLENPCLRAGETLHGVVKLQGGKLEQSINGISISLMTKWLHIDQEGQEIEEEISLGECEVAEAFVLNPGEDHEFDFHVTLPDYTPIDLGDTDVWLRTDVDIARTIDEHDDDDLEIMPHEHAQVVYDAIGMMGFRLAGAGCAPVHRSRFPLPFIQAFQFVPSTYFRGQLDELVMFVLPDAEGVEIFMEIDRRGVGMEGLVAEMLDLDESYVRLRFEREHLAEGPERIAGALNELISDYL